MKKQIIIYSLLVVFLLSSIVGCANDPIDSLYTDEMYAGAYYDLDGNPYGGGTGDVTGPVGAVDNDIAVYDGITGKIIKDSGVTVGDISSLWATDANGINYVGSVGIHTSSSASSLLSLYSSDGVSNDPVLWVGDNSASAESVGIRVNMSGAKTDYTDGMYITNVSTSGTAGADKYGLRIKNTGNWNGAGAVNYGLYIEEPTGGTTNIGAYFEGDSVFNDPVVLAGDGKVFNAIWIDAGGIKSPGAKPATAIAQGVLETPAWRFSNQALVANQESVSFSMRIPERMDRTVEPTITVGWSSTTTAGNVKWQLEYLWRSADESTIAAAQETLTVTSAVSGSAEGFVASTFTGIDIPSGTDICIHCKITRLSADVADTVADDVELHGLCYKWTSNKLGS